MKAIVSFALVAVICAAPLYGGPILGSVTEGGKPVPEGTGIVVDCGGQQAHAKTDKFGSYRVTTEKTGICSFTLTYKDQKPTASITSLSGPVTADFELQLQDGKYKLNRR